MTGIRFHDEIRHVLRRDGVIAVWAYELATGDPVWPDDGGFRTVSWPLVIRIGRMPTPRA